MDHDLHYQTADLGVADPAGSKGFIYLGKTYRIPKEECGTKRDIPEWETHPNELLKPVVLKGPPWAREETWRMEPVPRAPIERTEVFDQDSGDLLILWRIPYRSVRP